ncbi:MAG: alpha/beta-hydrolase family protein [Thermoleophilia bacterium]|nr:alpha/beta-hydrolase family protein [Thermoleophilia bacterium]
MGNVTLAPATAASMPAAADAARSDHGVHVDARLSGLALGALGVVASFTPSSFARTGGVQAASTIVLGLTGVGLGYALADPIDQLGSALTGSDDARVTALAAGATGAGIWGATRLWARLGSESRIVRPLLGSAGGLLGFAGLAGAAALTAGQLGSDDDGRPSVAAVGVGIAALAGTAAGLLALRGRMGKAPTALEAARYVLDAGESSVQGITSETATAMRREHVGAARAHYTAMIAGGDEAAWDRLGRNGRNFVAGTATTDDIARLSGLPALARPERIYVGVNEAATPEARVQLAMQRLEATGAFEKGNILVVAPVATGRFNPVTPYASEVYARGDITSVAIQTSESSPVFAMHKIGQAGNTHRMLVAAISQRLTTAGRSDDTHLLLQGLCYGGWAEQHAMLHDGIRGVAELGVDHALFQGTPGMSLTQHRAMFAVQRGLEPAGLVAHSSADVLEQAAARTSAPTVTWIVNPDDPVRLRLTNFFRVPERVGGQNVKRTFIPIATAVNELLDTVAQARRMRGGFAEVGHDYRAGTPRAVKVAFGFDDVSMDTVRRVEHEVARQERLKLIAGAGR